MDGGVGGIIKARRSTGWWSQGSHSWLHHCLLLPFLPKGEGEQERQDCAQGWGHTGATVGITLPRLNEAARMTNYRAGSWNSPVLVCLERICTLPGLTESPTIIILLLGMCREHWLKHIFLGNERWKSRWKMGSIPKGAGGRSSPGARGAASTNCRAPFPLCWKGKAAEELPVPNGFGVAGGKVLHRLGGHRDLSSCSGPDTASQPSQKPGSPQIKGRVWKEQTEKLLGLRQWNPPTCCCCRTCHLNSCVSFPAWFTF